MKSFPVNLLCHAMNEAKDVIFRAISEIRLWIQHDGVKEMVGKRQKEGKEN